jgi:hypothetical protein
MSLALILLILTATATVYVGSKLSVGNSLMPLEPHELENTEMTYAQALIIPVSSSVCLLILFFYFAYAQYLLMGLIVLVGACALFQLLNIAMRQLCTKLNDQVILGIALCMTIVAVIDWVVTGNIIVHNLLGCALCTVFISTLRFPSLKIATLCLTLLVAYDIFWVFCSEYFFAKNVMVEVATKVASNPLYEAGQQLHFDMVKYVAPTIELPIKLMFPNYETGRMVMLGLGDIALPGALVAFALRCDVDIAREKSAAEGLDEDVEVGKGGTDSSKTMTAAPVTALFNYTMAGYFLGLIAAFVGNTLSGLPQPALIYLVPGVLLAMMGKAWQMGQLKNVWHGPSKGDSTV